MVSQRREMVSELARTELVLAWVACYYPSEECAKVHVLVRIKKGFRFHN